jgi:hypothetical protein
MSISHSDTDALQWRKARLSAANGACVEIASMVTGVAIRDSKNPDGAILKCTADTFHSFLDAAKKGKLQTLIRS